MIRVFISILLLLWGSATAASAQPVEGFADLAEQLSPSVVNISAVQRVTENDDLPAFAPGSPLERFNDLLGDGPRIANSLGSGFIIGDGRTVVTNNHVIEDADEVEVTFPNGRTFPTDIIGRDPETDLAVLRIQSEERFPTVEWANSDQSRIGDWVVAIGNPFGLGGSLTAGVISARGREIGGAYDDYIQTDVAINQGNSGGPLFTLGGDVVGVNTAIYSPTGTSVGISFSIPSNIARQVVNQLLEYGETRRGWLGVRVQTVTSDMAEAFGLASPRGAIVNLVEDDSPAAEAGLVPGDLILAFNGQPVPDDRRLPIIVAQTEIGTLAPVDILRRGEAITLEVEVQRLISDDSPVRPSSLESTEGGNASATILGLSLAPITDALRRQYRLHPEADGLVVLNVDEGSDAMGKVREGDVVEEIDWQKVIDVVTAREVASEAAGSAGDPVLIVIDRRGQYVLQTIRP